jgi:hypothetical protein
MLVIGVHIAVIARWSGKIDGFMSAAALRFEKAESEIARLRDARHAADGIIQRHDGLLKSWDRRMSSDRRELEDTA